MKNNEKLYAMSFKSIYDLYIKKVERKGQSREDLLEILLWLTGFTKGGFEEALDKEVSLKDFFNLAPKLNPNRGLVTGSICGVKIEEITDPLMKEIRIMDKVVDELARGKKKDKIMR